MNRRLTRLALLGLCLLILPCTCPAPLIYRAGEGWSYEPIGGAKWIRTRAKDQLEVAQAAFDKRDYRVALKAARHVIKRWPYSDFAPQAQYLVGRCYEARRMDEKAFKEYQKLVEKYPKIDNYQEVLHRQFAIANRFLAGQWFKLWGYIPIFPSMDKTADMYAKLIKNGPYSDVAAQAQMNIGAAREKQKEWSKAVQAYEKAADRYHDQKNVASDALYKAATTYQKEATTADYDQSVAGKAIATYSDFSILHPDDPRVSEAQSRINALKTEQARGSYAIARFYEKGKHWDGALIYYNEVLIKDPNSKFAQEAKNRIAILKKRTAQ
ncbi:MAG: tetratricopeptide repeat protein [Candidatus Omnitrophica bacterium]|nr:tetratricopeptide repeat protein [Candidatus Omnitrophota bacterium]